MLQEWVQRSTALTDLSSASGAAPTDIDGNGGHHVLLLPLQLYQSDGMDALRAHVAAEKKMGVVKRTMQVLQNVAQHEDLPAAAPATPKAVADGNDAKIKTEKAGKETKP